MVALRCASLALLVAVAFASECDKDELDLCDDMVGTECDAEELDLCDGAMGGGGSATECDADELDLCDDTSGGGGNIDDSASPLCDGEELDLCDYMTATHEPTAAATPAPTPAATPEPTSNACLDASTHFAMACTGGEHADAAMTDADKIGKYCEGDCKSATAHVMSACAGLNLVEGMEVAAKGMEEMCSPCMLNFVASTQACFKDGDDSMDKTALCSDACATVMAQMKSDKCDDMSDGRRLSAKELKMVHSITDKMVTSFPGARRLGSHEEEKPMDSHAVVDMMKMQKFMCSACGDASMTQVVTCGFEDEKDDHDDDHDRRRLDDHMGSKKMCWESCQDASQKVMDVCKADRRLAGHEHDEGDEDDMNPEAMHANAENIIEACKPCGVAMMAIGHFEEQETISCLDETSMSLNDQCKDHWCAVKNACPAASGLTEAPKVAIMSEMTLEQYVGTMTLIDGLGCGAAPTPTPTTEDTILTVQYAFAGDYQAVVGDKKDTFLTECTEKLEDGTVCSDVRAGSIIVDITGKMTAATAAVKAIEATDDKSLTLASFGALAAQGKVATVVAAAEAVTKLSEVYPTPAPATPAPPPPPAEEDADGAVRMYGTLAGTSVAIAVANIL